MVPASAISTVVESKTAASFSHLVCRAVLILIDALHDHEERGRSRPQLVQLRLSRALVQRIDKVRKHRLVVPSRHTWLLEALLEKLETEEHLKAS